MLTRSLQRTMQKRSAEMLDRLGFVLTPKEQEEIEVVELGLGEVEHTGLQIVVYVNTDRYCAKELIMLPRQTCPQHRHPPIPSVNDPGKMETFRCRWGKVWLYVEGVSAPAIQSHIPEGSEHYYTVMHEIELNPGDQYTISPNTWHWFQAGDEGALVSEFSSTSRDEFDEFIDPRINRLPEVVED